MTHEQRMNRWRRYAAMARHQEQICKRLLAYPVGATAYEITYAERLRAVSDWHELRRNRLQMALMERKLAQP